MTGILKSLFLNYLKHRMYFRIEVIKSTILKSVKLLSFFILFLIYSNLIWR